MIVLTFSFLGMDFIAPCKCKGTSKYVHRECLDQWRAVRVCFKNICSSEVLALLPLNFALTWDLLNMH